MATHPTPGDLVARFGSPLYVYDADLVRQRFREFRAAFSYDATDLHFAIVCNKNPYLVRLLLELGAGIHANTPGDAHAALAAGTPAARIVYSGANLNAADFDFVAARGLAVNLDSIDQLRDYAVRGRGAVGMRLLVDREERGNRIGIAEGEIGEALEICAARELRLTSLHMYAGTNTRRVARFFECLERLIAASGQLPDLDSLDLGGGFGLAYREGQTPLELAELGRGVSARMTELSARRGRRVRLMVEPGRFLVGESGTLYTTAISVKERGGRRYIGVDSTVGNIVVESVYHPYHRITAVHPRGPALEIPADVCGNTTHSRDFLGRGCQLPEVRPGDLLALADVGAYGYAMSSHFLNRPRPAEVVVDGGAAHLTTRRETLDDLLATYLPAEAGARA